MIASGSDAAVRADLDSARFRAGVLRGQWRLGRYDFPVIEVLVMALPGYQGRSEFLFRFEVSNFPTQAPEVKIWDPMTGRVLALPLRPTGPAHVLDAFKDGWPGGATAPSVYRPWERHALNHNNWTTTHPYLTWHAGRDLAFVLEDLHGLINSSVPKSTLSQAQHPHL